MEDPLSASSDWNDLSVDQCAEAEFVLHDNRDHWGFFFFFSADPVKNAAMNNKKGHCHLSYGCGHSRRVHKHSENTWLSRHGLRNVFCFQKFLLARSGWGWRRGRNSPWLCCLLQAIHFSLAVSNFLVFNCAAIHNLKVKSCTCLNSPLEDFFRFLSL